MLTRFTNDPAHAALVLDLDGTLAPIAPRPELAEVPESTRRELARLAGRYRLVACLSGRPGAQAAGLVGVEGVRYVGNHGLELHPDHAALALEVARFRRTLADAWPVEDKVLSLSLHYREAEDEAAARAALEPIARQASEVGLDPRWGRKVLEIRPRVEADKGTAVRALLADPELRLALYAGDDTTDLDAFRGLAEAGLDHVVAIAVRSPEAPAGLLASADLVVEGPEGLAQVLSAL